MFGLYYAEIMYRRCRKCGCGWLDCHGCIARTGAPCFWVDIDLCSACVDLPEVASGTLIGAPEAFGALEQAADRIDEHNRRELGSLRTMHLALREAFE